MTVANSISNRIRRVDVSELCLENSLETVPVEVDLSELGQDEEQQVRAFEPRDLSGKLEAVDEDVTDVG